MASKLFLHFLILILCNKALSSEDDNSIDVEDDFNDHTLSVDDLKNEILNEDNLQNLGGVLSNFMQSDGGKQIGNMIMNGLQNGGSNVVMGQLLQGLGGIMQQQSQSESPEGESSRRGEVGDQPGLSPELLGNLLSLFAQTKSSGDSSNSGIDLGSIVQLFLQFGGQDSSGYMSLIPNILNIVQQSFTGPEAQKREAKHEEHRGVFPPIVEKLHVFVDHFVNSEMGSALMESTGVNRALKIFADEQGNFSYAKFVEMFENHSFRKHWLEMATKRVANFVSYFADPYTQKK